MSNLAVQVAVIESESGWGSKIDDHMVCLSVEDAEKFTKEFNEENKKSSVPDWYMMAEGNPTPIDLTDAQYEWIKGYPQQRAWWSTLKHIK